MKPTHPLHSWDVSPAEAAAIQRELAARVIQEGAIGEVRVVAGADAAFSPDGRTCIAGVVAWDATALQVIEQRVARRRVRFPYVPGLLSFREGPALLSALRQLKCDPDVFLFDGQGRAHPRRLGMASHIGLWLDRPTIGCAKSLLVGEGREPQKRKGLREFLTDNGETIGAIVRTRDGVRPLYVSVGHRVSLMTAVRITLRCCTQFRLPEPTRLADKLVSARRKKS